MKEIKEFLPIGTVVKLKNENKRVMIIGFCSLSIETKKVYNYVACLYPEGIVNSKDLIMFDNIKIEEICYKGLVDKEEKEFKGKLMNFSNVLSNIDKNVELSRKTK